MHDGGREFMMVGVRYIGRCARFFLACRSPTCSTTRGPSACFALRVGGCASRTLDTQMQSSQVKAHMHSKRGQRLCVCSQIASYKMRHHHSIPGMTTLLVIRRGTFACRTDVVGQRFGDVGVFGGEGGLERGLVHLLNSLIRHREHTRNILVRGVVLASHTYSATTNLHITLTHKPSKPSPTSPNATITHTTQPAAATTHNPLSPPYYLFQVFNSLILLLLIALPNANEQGG